MRSSAGALPRSGRSRARSDRSVRAAGVGGVKKVAFGLRPRAKRGPGAAGGPKRVKFGPIFRDPGPISGDRAVFPADPAAILRDFPNPVFGVPGGRFRTLPARRPRRSTRARPTRSDAPARALRPVRSASRTARRDGPTSPSRARTMAVGWRWGGGVARVGSGRGTMERATMTGGNRPNEPRLDDRRGPSNPAAARSRRVKGLDATPMSEERRLLVLVFMAVFVVGAVAIVPIDPGSTRAEVTTSGLGGR